MNPFIKIKRSTIHGAGAFAARDIPKATRIIEYVGELISNTEADRREKLTPGLTYIFMIDDERSLDGAKLGNESKFLNHSCTPNCDWVIEGKRVFYDANRDIKQGEELTIDYAFEPDWPKEKCFCQSANCRGYLNLAG